MTPTRNPNIKLYDIGNLYSIEDTNLLVDISKAVVHFQRKFGRQPTAVLIHPDNKLGLEGEIEIENVDTKEKFTAHVIIDKKQGKRSFTVMAEGTLDNEENAE